MRLPTIVALLILPATVSAQPFPCPPAMSSLSHFDSYKPSHLSIIRNYGATLLAQAPLDSLLKLDPYVPSDGVLLRQMGGAIPVWGYLPFAWPPVAVPGGPCASLPEPAPGVLTAFSDVVASLATSAPAAARTTGSPSDRNRGISIEYDGRVWVSAGPAVAFRESAFVRVGERAGTPIYRRAGSEDDVIYIQTLAGVVAPFSAAR
jgi:hypothetical protein